MGVLKRVTFDFHDLPIQIREVPVIKPQDTISLLKPDYIDTPIYLEIDIGLPKTSNMAK